jgi:hypothetical protein
VREETSFAKLVGDGLHPLYAQKERDAREASPPGRAFRAGYPIAVECAFAASRLCNTAPQPLATEPLGFYVSRLEA